MNNLKPIIKVDNVIKDFLVGKRNIRIIKKVNLDIYPGEFVMLFGPSGCGKSTLLNIINGWEEPTTGKVWIQDIDIYKYDEDERVKRCRKTISMIHQAPNWVKSLTVIENIMIPHIIAGFSRSESHQRAVALLSLLKLEKFQNYHPMDLSGGQQQRISILRALINNPQIIVADEPTGNLDTSSTHVLMGLFEKINKQLHRTIIMVTHGLELLKYASKTVNIIDGEIVKVTQNNPHLDEKIKAVDVVDLAKKGDTSFQMTTKEDEA